MAHDGFEAGLRKVVLNPITLEDAKLDRKTGKFLFLGLGDFRQRFAGHAETPALISVHDHDCFLASMLKSVGINWVFQGSRATAYLLIPEMATPSQLFGSGKLSLQVELAVFQDLDRSCPICATRRL